MRLRESAMALASRCSAEILAGRYRLDALIGSGGAADVHRGFDLRLRRPVAVKVFRPGTGFDADEGLGSEAVILARLQHPGLVTAYDAGRHDGRAYLVMQLIEGSTLKGRIAQGPLSYQETAALGAGLAGALAHAHEAGIVHRDVKPSNILLDASGRTYLTDFGISRLVDATTHTATGTLIGTAAYLSPEQVLGQPVGRPADIYALGLVLVECLTGRLEYDGGPLEAAIARLHRSPVLPGSLPEALAVLLRDMTALDAQTRPSALACARTLAALADTPRLLSTVATTGVTPVVPVRERAQDDDFTHPHPLPAPDPAAPKTAPAHSRVLVAGGTVALAAVMAATLAVTDGTSHPGDNGKATRAVSRPAETGRTESSSPAERHDTSTAPVAPPPTTHSASAGQLRDAASRTSAAAAASDGLSRKAARPAGVLHNSASDRGVQANTKPDTSDQKPGKSKKAKKAEEAPGKAQKKAEKKAEKNEAAENKAKAG
ncbi:serine/threonine-protein kinase [Streptomyces sp. NPDC005574]|uniref:serine/threonine-protein kinase n=1 Tax=Streptomyces sp. NPDC005574 TaxID=3156891 RepID=UPI0033AFA487